MNWRNISQVPKALNKGTHVTLLVCLGYRNSDRYPEKEDNSEWLQVLKVCKGKDYSFDFHLYMLFCKADVSFITLFKEAFTVYQSLSGLTPNPAKSDESSNMAFLA